MRIKDRWRAPSVHHDPDEFDIDAALVYSGIALELLDRPRVPAIGIFDGWKSRGRTSQGAA